MQQLLASRIERLSVPADVAQWNSGPHACSGSASRAACCTGSTGRGGRLVHHGCHTPALRSTLAHCRLPCGVSSKTLHIGTQAKQGANCLALPCVAAHSRSAMAAKATRNTARSHCSLGCRKTVLRQGINANVTALPNPGRLAS